MAIPEFSLQLRPRGKPIKRLPEQTSISSNASTSDLYHRVAAQSNLTIHRIRLTKGSDGSLITMGKDVPMYQTGLRDQSVVYVKDLGPQLAWRTVFVIEYLGPILIHPLFYFFRPLIYGTRQAPSDEQTLVLAMILIHFLKREFETLFIHRFSLATMPAHRIFINSAHYWVLAGAHMAYWANSPSAPNASGSNPLLMYSSILLFAVGEIANFVTHMTLRNLRAEGSTGRSIPKGLGFDLVTCPNYMFEVLAWCGILLASRSLATLLFVLVGTIQMMLWGRKKELRYRREFRDEYVPKSYSVIPGIY